MSKQKTEQVSLTFDWALLYFWLIATTVGWVLGCLVLPAIAVVTAGVGAGVMQSFLMLRRILGTWRRILVTAVGWLAGLAIVIPVVRPRIGFPSGAVMVATTGTAQWFLLRHYFRLAGWWIPVSILAWATGLSIAPTAGSNALPRPVLSGVLPAVVAGITLGLLLNFPKPPQLPDNPEDIKTIQRN